MLFAIGRKDNALGWENHKKIMDERNTLQPHYDVVVKLPVIGLN
jgi:hypothetical protein